jgi:outer membrane protein OmpA-like peptidoglycan-associated protein
MNIRSLSAFLLCFLMVFSCSQINYFKNLSDMQRSLKTRGGYSSYLALEYLEFSRSFYVAKDSRNGDYFAKKGFEVSRGYNVFPESPIKWKADKAQVEEMILMQRRMEMILNEPQAKDYIPIQLAHLTYLYDCWISRESKELFRISDLGQCTPRFYKLLEELERYIDSSKKYEGSDVVIKTPEFRRFEILFDHNSFKTTDAGRQGIIDALDYITTVNEPYRVLVVGSADEFSGSIYDKNLAFKRAENVREYMIKNGVDESFIEIRSIGEDFPDIITKDGEIKQANRKVGIYVLRGSGSFLDNPLPAVKNQIYKEEIKEVREQRGIRTKSKK